jgi:mRNA interferase RelE/StbE
MARRIRDAAALYAEQERGDVVKLAGSGSYRLRVGDWRVIFDLDNDGLIILALRVLNRRDAYR